MSAGECEVSEYALYERERSIVNVVYTYVRIDRA